MRGWISWLPNYRRCHLHCTRGGADLVWLQSEHLHRRDYTCDWLQLTDLRGPDDRLDCVQRAAGMCCWLPWYPYYHVQH